MRKVSVFWDIVGLKTVIQRPCTRDSIALQDTGSAAGEVNEQARWWSPAASVPSDAPTHFETAKITYADIPSGVIYIEGSLAFKPHAAAWWTEYPERINPQLHFVEFLTPDRLSYKYIDSLVTPVGDSGKIDYILFLWAGNLNGYAIAEEITGAICRIQVIQLGVYI